MSLSDTDKITKEESSNIINIKGRHLCNILFWDVVFHFKVPFERDIYYTAGKFPSERLCFSEYFIIYINTRFTPKHYLFTTLETHIVRFGFLRNSLNRTRNILLFSKWTFINNIYLKVLNEQDYAINVICKHTYLTNMFIYNL